MMLIAGYLFAIFLAVGLTWWCKYVSSETREHARNFLFIYVLLCWAIALAWDFIETGRLPFSLR